ncbi:hypothetical protein RVR_8349 [Actinacidiphila reveromycinica]|uniref:DUF2637 domain-containing protein n=1 Tax=Actinacidiphila reveromycinica TaxID=659352 RepID=A0A7U3UYG2_9ACTN|nr:DUF2637 domain-containing protein [Streptomyces sp. SN-593]BBB01096.1 hypothetical protein RVR_8349 [Streptomyces sp. SN-593]
MTSPANDRDRLTRASLIFVMVAALTVGTWSIYTLLHERFDAPRTVALFGCAMFDSAALFFARLAQRYATSPDSGFAPRLAMLATVTASAWTNWEHAHMKGWGTVGGVVLGAAPVIAEVAFELYHRYVHRESLRARGRVPAALPVFGKWAWLMYLPTAFKAMRKVVGYNLATASSTDAPGLTTVMRDDAAPHHPTASPDAAAPHHLVITVQQPAAIAPPTPEPAVPPRRDAPTMPAGQATDAPLRPAPVMPIDAQAAADDALRGKALSKADAVRAVRAALPDAAAPQIADALMRNGIAADAKYVRTVLSRDKRATDTGTGYYP